MTTPRVVQWDVHARDAVALRRFSTDVFGWRCTHLDDRGEYGWMLTADGAMPGGIRQAGDGEAPGVSFFVQVSDVTATTERARELGGGVCWGPVSSPDGMVRACIGDPESNGILLIRPSDTGQPYASRPPIDADA